MAERYWEHRTQRQHSYVDVDSGRIIGTLFFRLSDMLYEAYAYDRKLGDYLHPDLAYAAVEQACVSIEEERHQATLAQLKQRAAQADGVAE